MRVAGVKASGEVKEDGSRVAAGCCPGVVDRSFFPDLKQGRFEALESKLLASAYLTASLTHW